MNVSWDGFEKELNKEVVGVVQKFQKASKITFNDFLDDKMIIISTIRQGIPWSFFEKIGHVTPFNQKDWAQLLNVSEKTLQRQKVSKSDFKPIHSEKIIELAEVTKLGLEVFGDLTVFKHWLNAPNFALGNYKPMDLLRDSYGKELVMGELTRIEHGIFA